MSDKMEEVGKVLDLKAVEKQLMTTYDTLDKFIEKSDKEMEDARMVSTETKNAVEKLAEKSVELGDKLTELEQKQAVRFEDAPVAKSVGEQFVESDAWDQAMRTKSGSHRLELKTTIVNDYTGSMSQPLVAGDRLNMVWHEPNRPLRIRDVLPSGRTNSNVVFFPKESSFTNNAAHQTAGSPLVQTDETALSESAIAFTSDQEYVKTIGHFIPVSLQALADSDFIASYVNNRLLYGLAFKIETELLNGTGLTGSITGINASSTAYAQADSPQSYSRAVDYIRDARRQAEQANYMPSVVVLNPKNWSDIELTTETAGMYVWSSPAGLLPPTIWGMRVVVSNSQTAGTFTVFDPQVFQVFNREDAAVEIAYQNSTDFQNLAATIRCYERLAFVAYSTSGSIKGTGI
jgi:HK97 family phage major capsid protein